jgi:hypothetical protein
MPAPDGSSSPATSGAALIFVGLAFTIPIDDKTATPRGAIVRA